MKTVYKDEQLTVNKWEHPTWYFYFKKKYITLSLGIYQIIYVKGV